jgi:hypothetical protein
MNVRGVRAESGVALARRGDDGLAVPQREEPERRERQHWPAEQGEHLQSRH